MGIYFLPHVLLGSMFIIYYYLFYPNQSAASDASSLKLSFLFSPIFRLFHSPSKRKVLLQWHSYRPQEHKD